MTDSPQPTDPPALVTYDVSGRVARVTLDSPRNRNALSTRLLDELLHAFERAAQDEAVRVVVLTHTGGTFCAGVDLNEVTGEDDPNTARGIRLTAVMRAIAAHRRPVVGQIDGHVRAGGVGLVAACDLVVAGPKSTFALTESRLGLAAFAISLTVLPRLTSRAAARYFLTGETFDAATARGIGLVTETADNVAAGVDELVERLVQASPQGLAESKALVNRDLLARFDHDREWAIEQSARLFASPEAREGMAAFLAKRPPSWLA